MHLFGLCFLALLGYVGGDILARYLQIGGFHGTLLIVGFAVAFPILYYSAAAIVEHFIYRAHVQAKQ